MKFKTLLNKLNKKKKIKKPRYVYCNDCGKMIHRNEVFNTSYEVGVGSTYSCERCGKIEDIVDEYLLSQSGTKEIDTEEAERLKKFFINGLKEKQNDK